MVEAITLAVDLEVAMEY